MGRGRRTAALTVMFALSMSGSALAVVGDGWLGGAPTMTAASSGCPAGKAVTGASASLGEIDNMPYVVSVTVLCQDAAAATGTIGAPLPGLQTEQTCDPGAVAIGMRGREGDSLDLLVLRCQSAALTGQIHEAGGFGGLGGDEDGPYDCPAGQQLTGLSGSVDGATLRHVQIVCAAAPDGDGDGAIDAVDNCTAVANPGQTNTDGDAQGNACDADDDNDGVADTADTCPTVAAPTANGCVATLPPPGPGPPGGGGGAVPPPPTPNPDTTKPGVSQVKLTAGTLALTASEAGTLQVKVERRSAGRRSGGRCVKPTKRLRRARSCQRYTSVGTKSASLRKGANTLALRFKGRALTAGTYRLTMTVTDAARNRTVRRVVVTVPRKR